MVNLSYLYASLMFLLGLIGFASNPSKAISSLVVGSAVGAVFLLLGWCLKKRKKGALTAMSVIGALLSMMLVWRAIGTWMAYFTGSSDKLVAALLISCMLVITLVITGLSITVRKLPRS